MTSYFYNEKTDLLEFKAEGVLTIDVILDYYNKTLNNDSLPRNLRALIDCRKANFDIDPQSLKQTFDIINSKIHKFHSIKEAILVDSSSEAAIATLFKLINSNIKNYIFRIFSTEEAAINWLQ